MLGGRRDRALAPVKTTHSIVCEASRPSTRPAPCSAAPGPDGASAPPVSSSTTPCAPTTPQTPTVHHHRAHQRGLLRGERPVPFWMTCADNRGREPQPDHLRRERHHPVARLRTRGGTQGPDRARGTVLDEPHVVELALLVGLVSAHGDAHAVALGRVGDIDPAQCADLAAPHPGHEQQYRGHRVDTPALEGDPVGLDATGRGGAARGRWRARRPGSRLRTVAPAPSPIACSPPVAGDRFSGPLDGGATRPASLARKHAATTAIAALAAARPESCSAARCAASVASSSSRADSPPPGAAGGGLPEREPAAGDFSRLQLATSGACARRRRGRPRFRTSGPRVWRSGSAARRRAGRVRADRTCARRPPACGAGYRACRGSE